MRGTLNEIFTDMATVLPEGEKGKAQVKHLIIGQKEAQYTMMRAAVTGGRSQPIDEGAYAQLFVGGSMVMSDTQMERRSNYEVVRMAKGDVLIAGLGLGMVLVPILAKDEVTSVTVIEMSQDAIDLVEPHIRKALGDKADKLTVICSDIFEWKPPRGARWDTIYFDIWTDLCTDNLKEMTKLHRRFARRKNPGGWMDSWEKAKLRYWKSRGGGF